MQSWLTVLGSSLLLSVTHVMGPEADVRSWIEQQLSTQTDKIVEGGVRIKLSIENALPANVSKNALIGRRRPGSKAAYNIYEVWWQDALNWRISRDYPNSDRVFYNDFIVTAGTSWQSNPGQTTIIKTLRGFPPSMDWRSVGSEMSGYLDRIFRAGLVKSITSQGELVELKIVNSEFVALLRYPSAKVEVRGSWRGELSRGFVDASKVIAADRQESIGFTTTYEDWKPAPGGGGFMASHVVSADARGSIVQTIDVIAAEVLEPADFLRVTGVPDAKNGDAFRGAVSVQSVSDYRNDTAYLTFPASSTQVPQAIPNADSPAEWLATVGWWVLGVLCVSFVVLRAKVVLDAR